MKINVPNQITIGRLVLAVIFFALISRYDHGLERRPVWLLDVCLSIFVVAAITDVVDGYLARRQNQITSLGRILDPFVDKVLVCGTFAFFAGGGFVDPSGHNVTRVQMWMVVLILGRELLVTGLRGFSEAQGTSFGATLYGKAKMVLQAVTAAVILFSVAHPDLILSRENHEQVRLVMVWATVLVTALSILAYLWKAKTILSETSRA